MFSSIIPTINQEVENNAVAAQKSVKKSNRLPFIDKSVNEKPNAKFEPTLKKSSPKIFEQNLALLKENKIEASRDELLQWLKDFENLDIDEVDKEYVHYDTFSFKEVEDNNVDVLYFNELQEIRKNLLNALVKACTPPPEENYFYNFEPDYIGTPFRLKDSFDGVFDTSLQSETLDFEISENYITCDDLSDIDLKQTENDNLDDFDERRKMLEEELFIDNFFNETDDGYFESESIDSNDDFF